jgi:hypothetical protein
MLGRHPEAEQEADALRLWDGDGAVRCLAEETFENTIAVLLERCMPATQEALCRNPTRTSSPPRCCAAALDHTSTRS